MDNKQKLDAIDALDLRSVREKFLLRKSWWWKARNDVNALEREYRYFLYLIATNPKETIVPWTQNLDDFWHEHILDTRKYQEDSKKISGEFLHHNPGLNKGTTSHREAVKRTRKIRSDARSDLQRNSDTNSGGDAFDSILPMWFAHCDPIPESHHGGHDLGGNHDYGGGGHDHGGSDSGSSGGDSSCGGGSGCGGGGCGGGGGD